MVLCRLNRADAVRLALDGPRLPKGIHAVYIPEQTG